MSTARLDIAASGTRIAVWVEGTGPALVMVHGSIADHTTFDPFIAVLRNHFTTFAMDRRGFGATPDTGDYTIDMDFADVAAVADAVAARTGGRVALWGHSYGANCAIGGAARTTRSATSSSTNRASVSAIHPARSRRSRPHSPGATTKRPSSPYWSTSWR